MAAHRLICIINVSLGLLIASIYITLDTFWKWQNSSLTWLEIIIWISFITMTIMCAIGMILWYLEEVIEREWLESILFVGSVSTWILEKGLHFHTNFMRDPIYTSRREVVDTLIKAGIHRIESDMRGRTSIHYACEIGDRSFVQRLVATHPPLITKEDIFGKSALNIAVARYRVNMVIDLIQMGAQKNLMLIRDYFLIGRAYQDLFQAIGWFTCTLKDKEVRQIRHRVYFESTLTSRLLMWIH